MLSLEKPSRFRLQRFTYTRQMLQALQQFHASGRLHLALTPAHFQVDGESMVLRSALDSEQLLLDVRRYAAPEMRQSQRGDVRSDLYALGRILFEAWTGVLPEPGDLPMLTAHLPELPQAIDRFFQDLLAGNPAERFADTAAALQAFETFEAAFYAHQTPTLLVGRDSELAALNHWFIQRRRGVFFVAGSAGVGKSSLIQQALTPYDSLRGKFQQSRAYTPPYSIFIEAMQSFLTGVLSLAPVERESWRQALRDELGFTAPLLYSRLPELRLLFDESAVDETPNLLLENPFNRAFEQLWRTVSRRRQLIVWLDDVQWADESSRRFFAQLLGLEIVWIVSGRQVADFETLAEADDTLERQRLLLDNLPQDAIGLYLQQTLQTGAEPIQSLVPVFQTLTQGNPLYLKVCLSDFEQRGILRYAPAEAQWQLGLEGEQARSSFSEQLLQDIMTRRLEALKPAELEVLGVASCLGTRFERETLAICLKQTPFTAAERMHALAVCERAGLLLPEAGGYRFSHDRLHEWVQHSFLDQEQQRFRLRAGRALLAEPDKAKLNSLVETLNPVYESLNAAECSELLDANLELIEQVLRQGGQREARALLDAVAGMGRPLSPGQEMKFISQEAFLVYLETDLAGAEARLLKLVERYPDANLTDAYVLLMIIYTQQNRYFEVVDLTVRTLTRMGVTIQESPAAVEALFTRCAQTLAGLGPEDLLRLSRQPSLPGFADAVRLFAAASAGFYNYHPELFGIYVLTLLDQALHVQGAPHVSVIYTASAILMTAQGLLPLSDLLAEGSLLTARAWGHLDEIAIAECVNGDFIKPWLEPYLQACVHFEKSWQAGLQSGNLQWAGYSRVFKGANLFLSGSSLARFEAEDLPAMLAFNATTQNLSPLDGLTGYALLLHALRQQAMVFDMPDQPEAAYITLIRDRGSLADLGRYYSFKAFVLLLFGEPERALEAHRAADSLRFLQGSVVHVLHRFTYLMLGLRLGTAGDDPDWQTALAQLQQHAGTCPANFGALYALVQAESPWRDGIERIADYERAIALARQGGLFQIEGLALESLAAFWQARQLLRPAEQALYESSLAYEQWGASQKVAQLLAELPQPLRLRFEQTAQLPQADPQLDLLMEISALFARTTRLDELLAAIMEILQTQTAAERMVLLVPQSEATEGAEPIWDCLARFEAGELLSGPVELPPELPLTLIRYVSQTRQLVRLPRHADILSQIPEARQLTGAHLLLPLVVQERLSGLIYLSSAANPEAFGLREELLLKALAGHMASSLANARLYRRLEATIQARTQDLQQANRELQQLLEERKHVIAMAAHDLKHPLGTLTLGVSMLEQMYERLEPAARQEAFVNLKKTLMDMNGNTERLLLAERLDFEPLEVRFQPVTVEEILVWLEAYRVPAQEKNIRLEFDGFGPGQIRTDPFLLRHILENLLANALKFSPFGSRVRANWMQTDTDFSFVLEDQGPGIPVEDQPRLFQKFARLTPRPTAGERSSGLGLFIVRQFVDRLGGGIRFDSQPGAGTRVAIHIAQS